MSLYAYQVFEIVAEQKSFARASMILNLTPSAVSHNIAKLEDEFGLKLFIRSRSGVTLTSDGERLRPLIRKIQHSDMVLRQEIDQIHGLASGTVRLGCFSSVSIRWLPQIFKSFRALYPDIEIQILEGGYDAIVSWVKTHTVDLAFVANDIARGMSVIPLHNDKLVCVAPAEYTPINEGFVTIEEVKNMSLNMNFILQRNGHNIEVLDLFSKYNMRLSSSFFIENDEAIFAMVESGFGFCIAPTMVAMGISSDVKILPFIPDEYRLIGLVTSDPQSISPATKKMRQHILSFLEERDLMNV